MVVFVVLVVYQMEKVRAFVPSSWKPQEKVRSGEMRKTSSWSSPLMCEPVVMVCHGDAPEQILKKSNGRRR
ncbi:hypothetical protein PVAP13_5KG420298 [Panicum virgatum]|uniref:Secreted protein n=1 Tax=Panicum virgatum TaxID=38727 RepID=A0A8T0SRV8_PANVG|nr:hypothetical protein PVAP13_5KG420298 [Panicum virgatum]